jgi:hypothetical protein
MQLSAVLMWAGILSRSINNGLQKFGNSSSMIAEAWAKMLHFSDDLINAVSANLREKNPDIRCQGTEIGGHHFWSGCEAGPQLLILRGNANRTGVQVTLSRHDATGGQQSRRGKAELLGSQQSRNDNIASKFQATIHPQSNARAQAGPQ